jgi:hypothetical protein
MKNAFIDLGQAVRELETHGVITAKKIIQKYNPGNTPEGFLYHAADAVKLSNEITELAVRHGVTIPALPILPTDEIEEFERGGLEEKESFFYGYNGGKRGPGRPTGTTKQGGRKPTHDITISDTAWNHAKKQGNASAYIEKLILADIDLPAG